MKLIIIIHLLFTGQFVLAQSQDSLSLPDLIPYKVDNKFGYCNPQLQMVIEPKFDFAEPFRKQCWEISGKGNHSQKFSSEETATVLLNGKRYLINNRGVITDSISSEYTEVENCYFIKQSSFKEQPRYECFERDSKSAYCDSIRWEVFKQKADSIDGNGKYYQFQISQMGAETRNQLVRQVYLIKGTRWVSNGEAGNYAFPDWQLVKTDTLCKPEYMNFNWSIGKMKYNDFLVAARLQNGNMLLMRMGLNKEPKQVTPLEFSAIRFLPNFPYMLVEVTKNQETYYVDFNGKEYKKLTK